MPTFLYPYDFVWHHWSWYIPLPGTSGLGASEGKVLIECCFTFFTSIWSQLRQRFSNSLKIQQNLFNFVTGELLAKN